MANPILQRMQAPGPKKVLACDGGGILGLMSVEVLARLEQELRAKTGNPALVLADFFDFVCGTSTGAIIATCIAMGMSTGEIRDFYIKSGPLMFDKTSIVNRLSYSYNDEPLAGLLRKAINDKLGYPSDAPPVQLGDEKLRTLLMLVMRNHTTDSPWPVSNNPLAHYNDRNRPDCNLNLPLWQLVRASTAAPTFFPPEVVVFGRGTAHEYSFIFVDGGVTTYNNPAFMAFQMATVAPFAVHWETGVDKLMVVSVGTGWAPRTRPGLRAGDMWLLDSAKSIPSALMNAASEGWDMTCRTIGECRFGPRVNREFGDGVPTPVVSSNWTGAKQFAYVRYNPDVTAEGLAELGLADIRPDDVQLMDSVAHVKGIQRVGQAYAKNVSLDHLRNFV